MKKKDEQLYVWAVRIDGSHCHYVVAYDFHGAMRAIERNWNTALITEIKRDSAVVDVEVLR